MHAHVCAADKTNRLPLYVRTALHFRADKVIQRLLTQWRDVGTFRLWKTLSLTAATPLCFCLAGNNYTVRTDCACHTTEHTHTGRLQSNPSLQIFGLTRQAPCKCQLRLQRLLNSDLLQLPLSQEPKMDSQKQVRLHASCERSDSRRFLAIPVTNLS